MSWQIPVKTKHMEEQSSHLPSMNYAKDIYQVARGFVTSNKIKNIKALEIGAAWGFSTLAILGAKVKSLMSVDPNTAAEGHNEAVANGYENHTWNCVRSDKFWNENPDVKYDLIYVDGSHLYDDVFNDLYKAWSHLNTPGLLMIDDWEHKKNIKADPTNGFAEYGVSLACFEFWRDHHNEIKDVDINGRVLWFKK